MKCNTYLEEFKIDIVKQYLECLLKHIKKNATKEELEYLLPWNIQF